MSDDDATKLAAGSYTVRDILEELRNGIGAAVDRVISDLPANFPEKIVRSISNGIKGRLRILETGGQAGLLRQE